jgi:acetolactate synthase regulatory subunit
MLTLHLVVSDRPDVPQRVMATCCRRQGAVLALTFARGGADGTAELDLTVDVDERLRRSLIDRIAGLVDVRAVRKGSDPPATAPRGVREGSDPPATAPRGAATGGSDPGALVSAG